MKRKRVCLTEAQGDAVAWALAPMADYWCTDAGAHERDGPIYQEVVLPTMTTLLNRSGKVFKKLPWMLELSQEQDINADLLYRLETQAQDVSQNPDVRGTSKAIGWAKAAANAATAIRRACPSLNNLSTGGGYI